MMSTGPDELAPATVSALEAAVAGLDELDRLALDEHVGRFEAVHAALSDALSDLDGT